MAADWIRRTPPANACRPASKDTDRPRNSPRADLRGRVPARDGVRQRLINTQLVAHQRRQNAHDGRAPRVLPVQTSTPSAGPAQCPSLEQLRAVCRPLAVRQNPPDEPPRPAPCPILFTRHLAHRISSVMGQPLRRSGTADSVQTSARAIAGSSHAARRSPFGTSAATRAHASASLNLMIVTPSAPRFPQPADPGRPALAVRSSK